MIGHIIIHFQTSTHCSLVTSSECWAFPTGFSFCGARKKTSTFSVHAKITASVVSYLVNQVFWLRHSKQDQSCPSSDVLSLKASDYQPFTFLHVNILVSFYSSSSFVHLCLSTSQSCQRPTWINLFPSLLLSLAKQS